MSDQIVLPIFGWSWVVGTVIGTLVLGWYRLRSHLMTAVVRCPEDGQSRLLHVTKHRFPQEGLEVTACGLCQSGAPPGTRPTCEQKCLAAVQVWSRSF